MLLSIAFWFFLLINSVARLLWLGVTIDEQVWEKFLRVTVKFWVAQVLKGADFISAVLRDFEVLAFMCCIVDLSLFHKKSPN